MNYPLIWTSILAGVSVALTVHVIDLRPAIPLFDAFLIGALVWILSSLVVEVWDIAHE